MSQTDDYWLLSNMQPWAEEEAEISGLIAIFRIACEKDKVVSSYELGAGISSLEDFILARIAAYEQTHPCEPRYTKRWRRALSDAVVGDN